MQGTQLHTRRAIETKKLVAIPLMGAVAFLLQMLEFPLPLIPSFLKLDFSTLPGLIGGLLYGPAAGIAIEGLKNGLHLLLKNTDGLLVGEAANFVAGSCFIVAAAAMYRVRQSRSGFAVGLAAGTLLMTLVMALANYYLLIPAYAALYQISVEGLLQTFGLDSMWALILYGITPFNLIKGLVLSLAAYPIFMKIAKRLESRP